mmetsp:Transcript_17687/g.37158  ORF Transcript_17687/g.37158 Transcript_17687/m.37158 type:complete len:397 (+) Transcript_17687:101-1291(+)
MNPRIFALIDPIQNRLNMISQSKACKKHLPRCGGSSGYAPDINQNNRHQCFPAGILGGTSAFNSQIEKNEIGQADTKNDVSKILFRLTILRHGQTTANAKGIIQGQQVHWPLTDVGVMQARMAHEEFVRLANGKKSNVNYFWKAYSSDLLRAKHTAEIVLGRDPKYPSSGVLMCQTEDLRLDERLREYALGVREGRSVSISWQEAMSEWRKENNLDDERDESNWHQYVTTKEPPRESAKDVHRRTRSFLHNLIEGVRENRHSTKGASSTHQTLNNDPPNILLVSHGGCIKILLQSSLGFPDELIGKLLNGSLTEVDVLSSLSSDHDTEARTHDECGKTVIYDGEVHCWYRLGSRVNDICHLEDHPMGLTQHHGHGNHSLDALYGALGDDASVAMEK